MNELQKVSGLNRCPVYLRFGLDRFHCNFQQRSPVLDDEHACNVKTALKPDAHVTQKRACESH